MNKFELIEDGMNFDSSLNRLDLLVVYKKNDSELRCLGFSNKELQNLDKDYHDFIYWDDVSDEIFQTVKDGKIYYTYSDESI